MSWFREYKKIKLSQLGFYNEMEQSFERGKRQDPSSMANLEQLSREFSLALNKFLIDGRIDRHEIRQAIQQRARNPEIWDKEFARLGSYQQYKFYNAATRQQRVQLGLSTFTAPINYGRDNA